jgi:aspartyl-tRNA synthetase
VLPGSHHEDIHEHVGDRRPGANYGYVEIVDHDMDGAIPVLMEPGDLLLIVADEWPTACEVLGTLRNDIGRPPVHEGPYRYLWVVDFPLFVGVDEVSGRPKPGHHPFTQPHPDDVHLLESDPLAVRSQAYDLVLNGWELGSGSIRIHQPDMQALDLPAARHQRRGSQQTVRLFLNLFRYGARHTVASPSGSIALWRSSPVRRTFAKSSPSRRPSPAWIR